MILGVAGQPDRAMEEARKAWEVDDRLWMTYYGASLAEMSRENFATARQSAERAASLAPWNPYLSGLVAGLLARGGEAGEALRLVTNQRSTPAGMATYHFLCGNLDDAIESYLHAIEELDPMALLFAAARFLGPLRGHPRWPEVARMMNLPALA